MNYSPALFKINNSSLSVIRKFVFLIFNRIGLTDGMMPVRLCIYNNSNSADNCQAQLISKFSSLKVINNKQAVI